MRILKNGLFFKKKKMIKINENNEKDIKNGIVYGYLYAIKDTRNLLYIHGLCWSKSFTRIINTLETGVSFVQIYFSRISKCSFFSHTPDSFGSSQLLYSLYMFLSFYSLDVLLCSIINQKFRSIDNWNYCCL